MKLLETNLFCKPDYTLTYWGAGLQPDGNLFVYGTDPKRRLPMRSEAIRFADFDQCLFLDETGTVIFLLPECQVETWEGCEVELRALMHTARCVRKPANFVEADDTPEIKDLLSKKKLNHRHVFKSSGSKGQTIKK